MIRGAVTGSDYPQQFMLDNPSQASGASRDYLGRKHEELRTMECERK